MMSDRPNKFRQGYQDGQARAGQSGRSNPDLLSLMDETYSIGYNMGYEDGCKGINNTGTAINRYNSVRYLPNRPAIAAGKNPCIIF